jgi:hypothetical protein
VFEVTKGYLSRISEESEEKKAGNSRKDKFF